MGPQKRIIYSLVFSIIAFFISMAVTLTPCQTAAEVPNPTFSWKFCSLNPDTHIQQGIQKLYFGYTESLTEAYIITLILSFVIAFLVLHFMTRSKKD